MTAQILQRAELADYFHCMAHWMNLSGSQAVKVAAIRSAQTVVHEAASLFRTSAKKTAVLKQCIEDADDTRVTKRQLISVCETRFLERHTAVVTLRQLFGFVAEALQEIKSWSSAQPPLQTHPPAPHPTPLGAFGPSMRPTKLKSCLRHWHSIPAAALSKGRH